MPADRPPPSRDRTLPDSLVFWIGVVVVVVSAASRAVRDAFVATRRFVTGWLWPEARRGARELRRHAQRFASGFSRWAAAATQHLETRRRDRQPSPRARAWARRSVYLSGTAIFAVVALVAASGPLLDVTAEVAVGGEVERELGPLDQTSVIVAAEGTPLGVAERERRRVVDRSDLPDHVVDLVLAAEDHRFRDHEGYDIAGLARAALTNAQAREVEQGGSTITQQLAKLNFTGDAPSISRKVEELLYAVELEEELSKGQLLERYLNQVYFGSGAHGIAAAAEDYFGADPADLTVAQAAVLAGIIQSPAALDPRKDPEGAQRRRDAVLRLAVEEGLLPRHEAEAAIAEPLQVAPDFPRPSDPVTDAVRAEVRTLEALGATPEERIERLETGGLRVETTVDPMLQQTVADAIVQGLGTDGGPTAAVAAVDPASGAIRALRSGREGQGGFDLARQGRRQPGSTFKPLTAVAALEEGLSQRQQLVGDGPIELDHGGPEPWVVDNFEGSDAGPVDLRTALRRSVNTAFAQLGAAVGVDAITDVVDRLGIDVDAALGPGDERGPSVSLGGVSHGVSPLELASAYTVFATGGQHADPYLVQRIVDPDGDVIYERDPEPSDVVEQDVAEQVRSMLEDALHSGTGQAARIDGVAAFGKTGTSQDGADAWFVGSTTNLTTAVWVGHPDSRVPMPEATGGELAAPIWRQVTTAWVDAHAPETWPPAAPEPAGQRGIPLPRPEPADEDPDDD